MSQLDLPLLRIKMIVNCTTRIRTHVVRVTCLINLLSIMQKFENTVNNVGCKNGFV